ncbi:MAG TPA: glycosyltransferase family 9 protein [Blastocatellia bacterium]|nr:glycosyltransferase family 9 protein [Blastocatellia bacterium]
MTPCLAALKSWRPDIRIAVVAEPLAAPLLEDHPLVDELITAGPDLSSRARLISGLRRGRFDITFNLHGGTTATIISALSGARHTVGYRGYRCSFLLSRRAPPPDSLLGRSRVHSVEQQLALLRWAGVPWPQGGPRLSLKVSPEAEASVRERLSACRASEMGDGPALAPFACLAPSAAMKSKQWSPQGFAEVADHLRERWHLPSVVIEGPGQEHVAGEVVRSSRTKPPIISGLSLKELIALTNRAAIFVGNDSGPMHIAAALERPIVAVFGSSNSDVWHPWARSPYRVVKARPSGPASGEEGDPIDSIPPGEVLARVDEVMRERAEARAGKGEAFKEA